MILNPSQQLTSLTSAPTACVLRKSSGLTGTPVLIRLSQCHNASMSDLPCVFSLPPSVTVVNRKMMTNMIFSPLITTAISVNFSSTDEREREREIIPFVLSFSFDRIE